MYRCLLKKFTSKPLGLLLEAAKDGDERLCLHLLREEAAFSELNVADSSGNTALHYAAQRKLYRVCERLVAHPCYDFTKIGHQNDRGDSALHMAADAGSSKTCFAILKGSYGKLKSIMRETLGAQNDHGATVLHLAAPHCLGRVCRLLLANQDSTAVNAVDDQGETALHVAARHGNQEPVSMILKHPLFSKRKARNNSGQTAAKLARTILHFSPDSTSESERSSGPESA